MMLKNRDYVRIIGNHSQGIRHLDMKCLTGHIELRRHGLLLKGEVVPVHAYQVRLDNGCCQIVAFEDLELIK